jgi:putative peptide zinc metalloprotease protein
MTSPELARTRQRALASTFGFLFLLVVLLGIVPFPDYVRVEGVVEPVHLAVMHAETDGFIRDYLQAPADVLPEGEPLIRAANPELEAEQKSLSADRRGLEARWRLAQTQDAAAAQILSEQLKALDEKISRVDSQLASLQLRAPLKGKWVSADIDRTKGTYIRRGERIGLVGSLDNVLVRGTAGQAVAAMLIEQQCKGVEIRINKRPDRTITGRIEKILPAGLELLPSEALGYSAGGSMPTAPRDDRGIKAAERFFEVRIKPDPDDSLRLLSGQRVIARIQLTSKPLAGQCWNAVRQLFQRRFRI